MGAWGEDIFDNDAAADFGHDVAEANDLDLVEGALDALLTSEEDADPLLDEYTASQPSPRRTSWPVCAATSDSRTLTPKRWMPGRDKPDSPLTTNSSGKPGQPWSRFGRRHPALLELWSEDDSSGWLDSLDALRECLDKPPVPRAAAGLFQRLGSKFVNRDL